MQLIENGIYYLIYLSEAQKYQTGVHSDYDPVTKNNKFYSKKKIFRMSIILDHIAKSPGLMFTKVEGCHVTEAAGSLMID